MSIGFITLFLFLLLLPGFSFQAGYHRGKFSRKYIRTTVFNDLTSAVLPSFLYHIIIIWIINSVNLFDNVALADIGKLFLGIRDSEAIGNIFGASIEPHLLNIALYFVISIILGGLAGLICMSTIRRLQLDLIFPAFRYDNEWYYLLSGEMAFWRRSRVNEKERQRRYKLFKKGKLSVRVKILSCVNDKAYIYDGEVDQFFLNNDGLDSIHLYKCKRYELPTTRKEATANLLEKAITLADDFVILADKIENIDVDYQLARIKDSSPQKRLETGSSQEKRKGDKSSS